MVLALVAVMVIAGPGLVFAAGSTATYPTIRSSVIIGPGTVTSGQANSYTLRVNFVGGTYVDNPSGTTFSAVNGMVTSNGMFTADNGVTKAKVTGSYTQDGIPTTASKILIVTGPV
jgi:hypothetical protein